MGEANTVTELDEPVSRQLVTDSATLAIGAKGVIVRVTLPPHGWRAEEE
jgi:hypothetical protein